MDMVPSRLVLTLVGRWIQVADRTFFGTWVYYFKSSIATPTNRVFTGLGLMVLAHFGIGSDPIQNMFFMTIGFLLFFPSLLYLLWVHR